MKTFRNSILCALFLFSTFSGMLYAQSSGETENYYSNPGKGIKATPPKPYYDTSVTSKSDDITVELVGGVPDTSFAIDTVKRYFRNDDNAIGNRFRGQDCFDNYYTTVCLHTHHPYYCGWGYHYYTWDPWYNPYWNGWYYYGWGGSYWHSYYSPYWSFGYGWGHPWYWDPFYYPGYYNYYGYYGYYGWGGAYAWNSYGSNGRFGHRYLGNGRISTQRLSRNTGTTPTPSPAGRGTVRRGGVDLNNGGRASYGNVSGTGSTRTAPATNARTSSTNTRYAKPESLASTRSPQALTRSGSNGSRNNSSSYNRNVRTPDRSSTSGRDSYNNRTTSSRSSYNNNRSTSTRSSYNNNSRTTTSPSRSSSSSRSSYGGSSSSRSSGGGYSGGSRSSGGGGHSGGSHSGSSGRR